MKLIELIEDNGRRKPRVSGKNSMCRRTTHRQRRVWFVPHAMVHAFTRNTMVDGQIDTYRRNNDCPHSPVTGQIETRQIFLVRSLRRVRVKRVDNIGRTRKQPIVVVNRLLAPSRKVLGRRLLNNLAQAVRNLCLFHLIEVIARDGIQKQAKAQKHQKYGQRRCQPTTRLSRTLCAGTRRTAPRIHGRANAMPWIHPSKRRGRSVMPPPLFAM